MYLVIFVVIKIFILSLMPFIKIIFKFKQIKPTVSPSSSSLKMACPSAWGSDVDKWVEPTSRREESTHDEEEGVPSVSASTTSSSEASLFLGRSLSKLEGTLMSPTETSTNFSSWTTEMVSQSGRFAKTPQRLNIENSGVYFLHEAKSSTSSPQILAKSEVCKLFKNCRTTHSCRHRRQNVSSARTRDRCSNRFQSPLGLPDLDLLHRGAGVSWHR